MAILTSKGARAPHQLKGRRNVRISRDRRGSGDECDKIEEMIGDLTLLETSEKTNLVGSINEVAKITSWSTEEIVVGTWIDGKPIYRNVLSIPKKDYMNWQFIDATDNLNIDKVLNAVMYGTDSEGYTDCMGHAFARRYPNNKFAFVVVRYALLGETLVLEYTKTTD